MSTLTYKLNVRFLGKLIIFSLVVAGAVFFVHRYQENRLTNRYLTQADNARDNGKPMSELSYLRQYIQLNPTDNAARVRYGQVMAKYARKPAQVVEAYLTLQKALSNDPGLPADIRVLCVKLALRPDVNLPGDARRELETLFKADPDNSEYEALYADALIRTGEYTQAEEFLTKSINRDKSKIDTYTRLAWVKRERSKASTENDSADAIIRSMLNQPLLEKNPKAWLEAAAYYRKFGPPEAHQKAIDRAVALAPNDHQVAFSKSLYAISNWLKAAPYGTVPKPTPEFEAALLAMGQQLEKLIPTLPPTDPFPEYDSKEHRLLGDAVVMFHMLVKTNYQAARYDEAEKWARQAVKIFKDEHPFQHLDLLEVLVAQKKYDEAKLIVSRLNSINFAPARVELQLGFMAAAQQKPIEAARHLERVKTELTAMPEHHRAASVMLAEMYQKTNEIDRVSEVTREAIPANPLDPTYMIAKIKHAESLVKLGRFSEAIANYRDVSDKEPKVLVPMLSLMISEKSQQPKATRTWTEIDTLLAKLPAGPASDMVHAEYLLAKGDVAGTRAKLESAAAAHPKSADIYFSRFNLELREKQLPAATAILSKAEAALGDTAGVRQMKIIFFNVQAAGKPEAAPDLEKLAQGLDKYTVAERIALYRNLSHAARFIQRRDLAWKWLDDVATLRGEEDMDLQFSRFDLALLDKDDVRLNKVLADIARLTGKDSPSTRLSSAFANIYKAERLVDQPAERLRLLETASELLSGVEATRKEWGKLYVAQGRVADLLKKPDLAIDRYQRALANGERQPEVISRLIDLYITEKRIDEATRVYNDIPEAMGLLGGDSDKVMMILLAGKNFPAAEDLARKTVPDDHKDPAKLLWRAKVHATAGNLSEAEKPLRRAYELEPTRSDTFLALAQLLVEQKKMDDAKQFIDSNQSRLKSDDAPLTRAQSFMLVGNVVKSREIFVELLQKQVGENLPLLKAAAGFFFKTREFAQAAPLLERILKHPAKTPTDEEMSRRMLALCVVVSGDHRSAMRALGIMGFATPTAATVFTGRESIEELEARYGVLVAIKGREARLATVAILKRIENMVPDIGTDKQLAYGKIQYALGDWADARRRLGVAANASDRKPSTMAPYASALLRRGELEDAKRIIDAIAIVDPDSIMTADLQTRHAVYSVNKPLAAEIMKKYLTKKDAQPVIAAQILEQLGMPEDAEPIFRRAADTTSQPQLRLYYAGFLARQGKAEEAMAEFEKAWPSVAPEIAVPMLTEAMLHTSGMAHPSVVSKAIQRVTEAVTKKPELIVFLAAIKSLVNEIPEAMAMYQSTLEKDPGNIFALNNLAFMLSLKEGKHNDALALLRRAIEQVGPQPTLLDTEAVILMTSGKPSEAIEKLNEVVVDEPTATAYMHLAQAYLATNRRNEAVLALKEAKKFNLRITDFHPLERNAIRTTIAGLGG